MWRPRDLRLLYTPREAATMLGIGRSTIYELLNRGEIRSVSIGASRRIPGRALADYVDALEVSQPAGTLAVARSNHDTGSAALEDPKSQRRI